MYLVGVLAENKEIIKKLEQEINIKKVDFIDLDLKTIENFRNVKFDIILMSNLKNYKISNSFKNIISKSSISVINADVKDNFQVLDSVKGTVITYGFNPKATITASSVNDDNISICIQRRIENITGRRIEPIEYVTSIENFKNIEISDVLGVKTIENILT